MIVENILAGGVEDGKHVKNALGHLTDMSHINFLKTMHIFHDKIAETLIFSIKDGSR
jgi:hypothetical protein